MMQYLPLVTAKRGADLGVLLGVRCAPIQLPGWEIGRQRGFSII